MVSEISLIIPAYNEEKRIVPVIENYLDFFRKKKLSFEIIVVCNNCSDSTPAIVRKIAAANAELLCLNFPFYTGKGGAIFEGFKAAKKNVVGFVDADESTAPEEFFRLFLEVQSKADAAIGSRAAKGAIVKTRQPFYRLFSARFFSFLVNKMFGLGISDTQCGAKVFRKNAVLGVLPLLKSRGWEFDVELLWKMKQSGFLIKEVPIVWNDAAYSRFSMAATPKMFFSLLKRRLGF